MSASVVAIAAGRRQVSRQGQGWVPIRKGAPDAALTIAPAYWIEPASRVAYPTGFPAYRRMREAEERPLARHRALGPDIDHYVWRRRGATVTAAVEIVLAVRPDTPPRIRRLVAETLRAIRRGRPAGDAIRQVARRFGLRDSSARGCIRAWIEMQRRVHAGDAASTDFVPATGCSLDDAI